MAIGNTLFDPGRVLLGAGGGGPYIQNGKNTSSFMRQPPIPTPRLPGGGQVGTGGNGGGQIFPTPRLPGGGQVNANGIPMNGSPAQSTVPAPSPTLGAETIRATGSGPFDAAYRQDLATYAGGQFQRPGGFLGFNPTGTDLFGNPTGGGNAPVPGMGTGLLESALGGQPFTVQMPTPDQPQAAPSDSTTVNSWQDWLKRYRNQGRMFGLNTE